MSEDRLKIGVIEWTGSVCSKISGTRGRPPPTILRVAKMDEWCKNFGRSFFRLITIHAFDWRTDGRTDAHFAHG